MPDCLRLRFQPDDDGTGELLAEVMSGQFSGAGCAWFDAQGLASFGQQVANTYPLPGDVPLSIEGGYWNKNEKTLDQVHLSLKFYPIGSRGTVGCRVTLATPVYPDQDRPNSQSMVAVELRTDYEKFRNFGLSIEALAKGRTREAVLQADG